MIQNPINLGMLVLSRRRQLNVFHFAQWTGVIVVSRDRDARILVPNNNRDSDLAREKILVKKHHIK